MIKSIKDGEEKAENFRTVFDALPYGRSSPIYKTWFVNLPLILRIKSLNFRDKINSFKSMINLSRNKGFGNWEIR